MLRRSLAAILCAAALAGSTAMAQSGTATSDDTMKAKPPAAEKQATPMMKEGNTAMSADPFLHKQSADQKLSEEFAGAEVLVREGDGLEPVGEIDRVIVDNNQQIVGAIVEVGGFLGIGSKPVALKWSNLQRVDHGGETAFVASGMTAERLEKAPPFMAMKDDGKMGSDAGKAPAPLTKKPAAKTE